MIKDNQYRKPLTSAQVKRLKSLPPEVEPPERTTINLGTFRLPERLVANIVRVEGSTDLFQVRVDLPGKLLGQRTPYDRIPTLKLDRRKLKETSLSISDAPLSMLIDVRSSSCGRRCIPIRRRQQLPSPPDHLSI